MQIKAMDMHPARTTSWKIVLPFYGYGALAWLVATILLVAMGPTVRNHYFLPHTLAITHLMALGWGTMVILGASHQLIPVLVQGALYSKRLAFASFILAGIGIPLLVRGFYIFDMGLPTKCGAILVVLAIVAYLVNLAVSMTKSKEEQVQAFFIFTATLWLLGTAIVGLLLLYNFTMPLLPESSLDYLPVHMHMGIVGWFVLMVMGVGSRLIPMFLISKYQNNRLLWWIYGLVNAGLLGFIYTFLFVREKLGWGIPGLAVGLALVLFGYFCWMAYRQRIRKKLDGPMRISLLALGLIVLPVFMLSFILAFSIRGSSSLVHLEIAYGFTLFFGWITAILLGMTFKTLPFIVWHKVYAHLAGKAQTPSPRDLYSQRVFNWMAAAYLAGFVLFTADLLIGSGVLLKTSGILLLLSSLLYNWNVLKLLTTKSNAHDAGDNQ